MGEITDALRRARAEREAAARETGADAPAPGARRPPARPPGAPAPAPTPAGPSDAGPEPVEISRHRTGFWQARVVHIGRPEAVAERFRHLAVRVRRELEARDGRILLVASALREEGKTVTSCNLALALASMASERRIALVDFDLRRPSVARALGARAPIGVQQVLRGEASLASARIPTQIPSLDLYLANAPTPHAHELLSGPALPRLLDELRERYAVVVCDTPPVLLVPDVPLVIPHFDGCLVVGRAGKTARSTFQDMLRLLPREKLLGSFLNQVRMPPHSSGYGYYLGNDEAGDDGDGSEEDDR